MCAWSERTLTRRLQYFEINFTDYDVDIRGWKWNIGKPNIHILSGIFFEFDIPKLSKGKYSYSSIYSNKKKEKSALIHTLFKHFQKN